MICYKYLIDGQSVIRKSRIDRKNRKNIRKVFLPSSHWTFNNYYNWSMENYIYYRKEIISLWLCLLSFQQVSYLLHLDRWANWTQKQFFTKQFPNRKSLVLNCTCSITKTFVLRDPNFYSLVLRLIYLYNQFYLFVFVAVIIMTPSLSTLT